MDIIKRNFNLFFHDGKPWSYLDDLLKFIAKHPAEANRPSKVERYFNGQKPNDGISTINDQKAIPLVSLLKYFFHRMDNSPPCREVACGLAESVFEFNKDDTVTRKKDEDQPIFNLYKQIASSEIGGQILNLLGDESSFPCDNAILTLVDIHKEQFTDQDWHKINII